MKKITYKKISSFLAIVAIFAITLLVFSPDEAAAAWRKAGITPSGDIQNSSIYTDLDNLVYFVMAVGGFWVIGCLLFAGMRLSAAQGNPQARTQGFIGLTMSALGLFIIVKAYDIAGWVAGFGG